MQRLTIMTLGAAFIGLCGYAVDAQAQVAPPCPAFESVVYFPHGSSELNEYSDFAIDSMAKTARTCGANSVVVQAPATGKRADAVASALRNYGVKAVIVPMPTLGFSGDTMVARSVVLRVEATTSSVG